MVRAYKFLTIALGFLALAGCKLDSLPVYEDGRLTVQELNKISGTYLEGKERLVISRASDTTDLLSWTITDTTANKITASGTAVLSRIPDSSVLLALLLDMKIGESDAPINWVTFLDWNNGSDLRSANLKNQKLFSDTIDAITDPDDEKAFILEYVKTHVADMKISDTFEKVGVTPQPDSGASDRRQQEADRKKRAEEKLQQCRATVAQRVLYCEEVHEYKGYGSSYAIDCTGRSRRAKRACRGWRFESESPNVGFRPYFCDPETKTKSSTLDNVTLDVCR